MDASDNLCTIGAKCAFDSGRVDGPAPLAFDAGDSCPVAFEHLRQTVAEVTRDDDKYGRINARDVGHSGLEPGRSSTGNGKTERAIRRAKERVEPAPHIVQRIHHLGIEMAHDRARELRKHSRRHRTGTRAEEQTFARHTARRPCALD